MATVPQPRSYNQILGDLIDGFQSRFGIDNLRVGSPILSILEAAAQSDLRSSQDIFAMLNSISLDRAEGDALDRIGADEDLPRRAETFATGLVNVGDSSFAKLSTKVYVGKPAPIVGSVTLFVADASTFPALGGSVYIGRGTANFEGPLIYTSAAPSGTFWTLSLSTPTQKFHNLNEIVVLAQGGNRIVPAGTAVQTQQGNVAEAIQFSTLYAVSVPDGEVLITGVQVTAKRPGTDGNVPAAAIRSFPSIPFTGATVTNPLPYINALPAEDDRSYRERIRNARQSRAKGTPLAIETGVLGTVALDENKSVLSASVVTRQGFPATLYIDDGTGYEEITTGVAIESIIADATGGEQYFEVNNRPVAKAFVETTVDEPFALVSGAKLAVKVNGIEFQHTFSTEEFRNIGNATAFEVVASINADDSLPFDARLSSNGNRVSIIADADTQEDLEVVPVLAPDDDANDTFVFTLGQVQTMLLYRNDRPLTKDGRLALLSSNPQALWAPSLTTPVTLLLDVDGTGQISYTFTAQDFITQQTGYTTIASSNSLASWATVLNARLAGVSAEISGNSIILVSNLGPDARARVKINGGSLVTDNFFAVSDSIGLSQDYTLDRNTGQIRLEESLNLGDTLALGTASTRAFVESTSIPTTNLSGTALQWWSVDGGAVRITSSLAPGSVITLAAYVTTPPVTWGDRVRITAAAGTPFNMLAIGDWAIFFDTVLAGNNQGAWRVAYVDPGFTYFDIERPTGGWTPQASVALVSGGIKFVRTPGYLQLVSIATAGNPYTAASFVDAINADLRGATAEIYRTTRIRVRTNTFSLDGNIALVAQNAAAEALNMTPADAIDNLTSHLGAVVGAAAEDGTPEFIMGSVASSSGPTSFVRTATDPALSSGHHVVFKRPGPDADVVVEKDRYGNAAFHSPVESQSGTTINLRNAVLQEILPTEHFYAGAPFAIGPEDQFAVLIDENEQNQRYVMPMWRALKPTTATYGLSNFFTDADNGNVSLAIAFGLTYDFRDFAAWMKARTKTHNESGDTTKTILYRYFRFGPEGDLATLAYTYPSTASSPIAVTTTDNLSGFTTIGVSLPSGSARTGYTVRNTTKIGFMAASGPGVIQTWTLLLGYSVTSAARVTKLNYKSQTANYTVGLTVTGFTSGATGVIASDVDLGTTGTLTLNAVTGTFLDGEIVTDTATGSALANGSQYGVTTLTLDIATPGATNHGFIVGNVIYLKSTSGSFGSGLKTLTAVSPSTVTYTDTSSTAVAATPNIGTVSYDTGEATLVGSTIVVNDIASITTPSGGLSAFAVPGRITSFSDQYWKEVTNSLTTTGTVPTWYPLTSTAFLSFFPINTGGSTAVAVAAAVNALAAAPNSTTPVTAVAVGDGVTNTGIISEASFDEFNTVSGKSYPLTDGLNWVRSEVAPVLPSNNYQFTFKDAITSTLATNSDWANEEVRLVPVTTKNVVDWFNTEGVSGLGSAAENARAEDGDRPQISTLLPGSIGGVRVQGGTANQVSVPVIGAAVNVAALYSMVTVKSADAVGIRGRQWVSVQNTLPMPKQVFVAGTVIASITTGGVLTLDGTSSTNLWNWANTATGAVAGFTWTVQKQGRFVAFLWDAIGASPALAGVQEGDWVTIPAGTGTLNSRNSGNFRIVRIDDTQKAFWIENPNALEERATTSLIFRTYDSAMVGDDLVINTTLFGDGNVGSWTISSVDPTNVKLITLDTSAKPMQAFTGPLALGAQSSLMQIFEGTPTRLIKRVRSVSPNSNPAYLDIKFETLQGFRQVSAVAGTLLQPLDKLGFDTDLFLGVDGYRYSAGLIQEVNKVAYGDPGDPAAYPGIIAAGAQVNIQGPLIRRITCSLALRLKSGVSAADIIERVRSAVASIINNTGVGEAIAISDIITAAGSVNGVVAVTILAPTFSAGSDLISIQPFEKPLVLDLVADISVALVSD